MKNYNKFYNFMSQYTEFYFEVSANEEERMNALSSDNLTKINKILSEYQMFIKMAEQYEKKRQQLFEELGLDGKTFREIIDMETGESRDQLEDLFYDFQEAVTSARDFNRHSLEITRENIHNSDILNYNEVTDPACYDQSGTLSPSKFTSVNLLDRKA